MRGKIFKNAIFLFICLGCFCMSKTFAYSHDYSLNNFENQFEKVSEDKYYVKPGTIFVSSDAIFLCCKGQFIPIILVECDEDGVFIRTNAFKWGVCPRCGYPLVWGVCVNSDCPSRR